MTPSFGGALMPVHVEDYQNVVAKENTAICSIISLRRHAPGSHKAAPNMDERLRELRDKIRECLDRPESARLPRRTLYSGLIAMFILFAMAQAAMGVVEQGGIVNLYCSGPWCTCGTSWVSAMFGLGLGFRYGKADFRSDNHRIRGRQGPPTIQTDLQAIRIKPAVRGQNLGWSANYQSFQHQYSIRRCSATAENSKGGLAELSRLKSSDICAKFRDGHGLHCRSADILGRAIASGVVSHVAGTEPMIHIISSTKEEAYEAIAEILSLRSADGSSFQIEINGHIFINERRVATRSWLKVAMFGVLTEPYDITEPLRKRGFWPGNSMSLNPLSPQLTNASRGGISTPFLAPATGPSLPIHRTDSDPVKSASQQSVRRISSDDINTDGWSPQIPRRLFRIPDPEAHHIAQIARV